MLTLAVTLPVTLLAFHLCSPGRIYSNTPQLNTTAIFTIPCNYTGEMRQQNHQIVVLSCGESSLFGNWFSAMSLGLHRYQHHHAHHSSLGISLLFPHQQHHLPAGR
jgi:hypothetical protein